MSFHPAIPTTEPEDKDIISVLEERLNERLRERFPFMSSSSSYQQNGDHLSAAHHPRQMETKVTNKRPLKRLKERSWGEQSVLQGPRKKQSPHKEQSETSQTHPGNAPRPPKVQLSADHTMQRICGEQSLQMDRFSLPQPAIAVEDEEWCKIKCHCLTLNPKERMVYCLHCDTWQHEECYYPGRNGRFGEHGEEEYGFADHPHLCRNCKPQPIEDWEVMMTPKNLAPISGMNGY